MIEVKNFILQMFSGAIFRYGILFNNFNFDQIRFYNNIFYLFNIHCTREEYQSILTYLVPTDNIRWSSIFGIMENAKKMLKIEDYSISQNSLEQVVLCFVKEQKDTFLSEEPIN